MTRSRRIESPHELEAEGGDPRRVLLALMSDGRLPAQSSPISPGSSRDRAAPTRGRVRTHRPSLTGARVITMRTVSAKYSGIDERLEHPRPPRRPRRRLRRRGAGRRASSSAWPQRQSARTPWERRRPRREFGSSEAELADAGASPELRIDAGSARAATTIRGRRPHSGAARIRPRGCASSPRRRGRPTTPRLEHAWLIRLAYALYLEEGFAEGAACYERVLALPLGVSGPGHPERRTS